MDGLSPRTVFRQTELGALWDWIYHIAPQNGYRYQVHVELLAPSLFEPFECSEMCPHDALPQQLEYAQSAGTLEYTQITEEIRMLPVEAYEDVEEDWLPAFEETAPSLVCTKKTKRPKSLTSMFPEEAEDSEPQRRKKNRKRILSNVFTGVLYVIAGMVVLAAFLTGGETGRPRDLFGYSFFTILTPSMKKTYPPDTLIVDKQIDPKLLQLQDVITFLREGDLTVTHRIVTIYENYEQSGLRAFEVQGDSNAKPDKDFVSETNVIGKVVWSAKKVGLVFRVIHDNLMLTAVFCLLFILFVYVLGKMFEQKNKHKNFKKIKKNKK